MTGKPEITDAKATHLNECIALLAATEIQFRPTGTPSHRKHRFELSSREGEPRGSPLSAMNSTRTGVGESPKDDAGVLVHDLTKVHGDGEHDD